MSLESLRPREKQPLVHLLPRTRPPVDSQNGPISGKSAVGKSKGQELLGHDGRPGWLQPTISVDGTKPECLLGTQVA